MPSLPPPNTPLVDQNGMVSPEWYRYFVGNLNSVDEASAGEVATPGTGGLVGGGAVSDGVTLSIADGGVSNDMLREGLPCSVIGRYQNSTGTVGDIQATADERVLSREGGILDFRDYLNGVSIGPTTPAPGRFTTLRIDTAPTVSAATTTHKVEVNINGSVYYLLASNV